MDAQDGDRRADADGRPGCVWSDGSATFVVWAPHADAVSVVVFDDEVERCAVLLESRLGGWWESPRTECAVGSEYLFRLSCGNESLLRMDPCARAVTNSVGRCVVVDDHFEWTTADFAAAPLNEWVIYEVHPGTFAGTLDAAVERLDLLSELGVNCVELMPVAEFAGDVSWGYNPALPFAVESTYGGPDALKRFVDAAHSRGLAVILDVVYNHLGPSDLDLWRFDGWHEGDGGGIYFYNDWRAQTPWGSTRPDYGRDQVRQYLIDNALMWLQDFHIDGLRLDSTANIRNAHGGVGPDGDLPDGRRFLADLTDTVHAHHPGVVLIAEDLQRDSAITCPTAEGGFGFDVQWAAGFVHPVRAALLALDDADRDLASIAASLTGHDAFTHVVYTESHDEVANGSTRVPSEISSDDPGSWESMRRAALGAVLLMTAPDVPMIFQGQEWADEDWFDDQRQLAWVRREQRTGTVQMWGDLVRLRTGARPDAGGLRGDQLLVHHIDDNGVLAYLRWGVGGDADSVLVVCNFSTHRFEGHQIGVPSGGPWRAVFDSAWSGYHSTGSDMLTSQLVAESTPCDEQPYRLTMALDAYAAAIFVGA